MPAEKVSYLDWEPTLDPGEIYSQPAAPQYPVYYKNQLYFLEQRAAEGGRSVIVRLLDDGSLETLTPGGFNIRSRVHEYGGKAFLIANDHIWFSNDADRRIYRQGLSAASEPVALTGEGRPDMAIDFQLTPDQQYLLFVQETPQENAENLNCLAVLILGGTRNGEIYSLVSGADFYANPVVSPDGKSLCWIEWDHPQMPWDGTRLMAASLVSSDGCLTIEDNSILQVAGGSECAVCQLQYSESGKLFFALDGSDVNGKWQADCWDLFSWDGQSVSRITNDDGEYGEGHWVFGQNRYVVCNEERIIAVRTSRGKDELVAVDAASVKSTRLVETSATSISHLCRAVDDAVFYSAASFTSSTTIKSYNCGSDTNRNWYQVPAILDDRDISVPEHLTYPTRDGNEAHAWFYRPVNHRYSSPENEMPPLLVMVHGGPTSRCDSSLSLLRQFWTGRGFAVLDINHRGSTGYCRRYRQSLQNEWGIIDATDVADAVSYVTDNQMADPRKVCIRGGSAGGYVVLRALTLFPEMFCAGACYYGIGNLVTLMEFTHKFEAHYLDGLLGEAYHGRLSDQPGSPYFDRSPIHEIDRLQSPMIIFQGLEDKVVPPRLAHELVASLETRGVIHEYVEYAGEGHGFRHLDTRVDSLQKEAGFFIRVISEQTAYTS